MILKNIKLFSQILKNKIPKKLPIQQSKGIIWDFFHKSKFSPTHNILAELFQYLNNTQLIKKQFPFIQSSSKCKTNMMILHLVLLHQKLIQVKIPKKQLESFDHNLTNYFFIPFAQIVQKSIPVIDFGQHFIESYINRLRIYKNEMQIHEQSLIDADITKIIDTYNRAFSVLVYQNKVKQSDLQVMKFSKYYLAHKKYLSLLSYGDMIQYKIKWGFQQEPKLIQEMIKQQKY